MKSQLLLITLCILVASCATPPTPKAEVKKTERKSYVIGDSFPDMNGRRPELVPQSLPKRVRYRFSEDSVVNRLADRLSAALASGDASLFGDIVMVQPGAWSVLKNRGKIGKDGMGELQMIDPKQGLKDGGMAGKFLRTKEEASALSKAICTILAEDGGFQVRSFTTREMAKWWVYIGFDIEEPVFVVETKGGKYKFVIGFVTDDHVFIVDELNALPDAA
jgi:hypothetical protein